MTKKATHYASTDMQAKNAQPREKLYRLSFGDGLQLEVRPLGGKYWLHRYTAFTTVGMGKSLSFSCVAVTKVVNKLI